MIAALVIKGGLFSRKAVKMAETAEKVTGYPALPEEGSTKSRAITGIVAGIISTGC